MHYNYRRILKNIAVDCVSFFKMLFPHYCQRDHPPPSVPGQAYRDIRTLFRKYHFPFLELFPTSVVINKKPTTQATKPPNKKILKTKLALSVKIHNGLVMDTRIRQIPTHNNAKPSNPPAVLNTVTPRLFFRGIYCLCGFRGVGFDRRLWHIDKPEPFWIALIADIPVYDSACIPSLRDRCSGQPPDGS